MTLVFLLYRGDEILASYMGVSKNRGTPKSSILIGFSIINHPFWGTTIYGNTHIVISHYKNPYLTSQYFMECQQGLNVAVAVAQLSPDLHHYHDGSMVQLARDLTRLMSPKFGFQETLRPYPTKREKPEKSSTQKCWLVGDMLVLRRLSISTEGGGNSTIFGIFTPIPGE